MLPTKTWENTFFFQSRAQLMLYHHTASWLRSYRHLSSDAWCTDDRLDVCFYWLVGGRGVKASAWVTSPAIGWCFLPTVDVCILQVSETFSANHILQGGSFRLTSLCLMQVKTEKQSCPLTPPSPTSPRTTCHLTSSLSLFTLSSAEIHFSTFSVKSRNLQTCLIASRSTEIHICPSSSKRTCGLKAELRHPFRQIFLSTRGSNLAPGRAAGVQCIQIRWHSPHGTRQ